VIHAALLALTQVAAPWPTRGWPAATPAERGLDPAPLVALDSAMRSGRYGHVDRLFVTRHGRVVFDARYPRDYRAIAAGRRSAIGCGPGACDGYQVKGEFNYLDPELHPFYKGSELHTLQSVTKSIAATVVGAAIYRGAIAGVQTPLLSLIAPEYRAAIADPARLGRATLADLLTMRTGIEWHEGDRPLDSTNTTIQLEASDDWVRFTLSQPMDADPGSKWAYNSGGSHLMAAVIRQATGQSIEAYARTHLFGPLGITRLHWKQGGGGLADSEGGLYLDAESLAKIGYLYLRGGMWEGTRLLPEEWTRQAVSRVVELGPPANRGYGYQWWRPDLEGLDVWAGMGFGGQFLVVIPALDVVAVANAWNVYGDRAAGLLGPLLQAIRAAVGTR
jgi:CubicO group peptidase (beta-lactamase class C family)